MTFANDNKIIEFPSLYHGTWDVSQKACQERLSDARLTITASSIEYWESSGVIIKIYSSTPDTLQVKLSIVGEGETWVSDSRFSVKESKLTEFFNKGDSFSRVLCTKDASQTNKQ